MYLVNVHVPRTWADFNDELLARVTPEYPHVHLLDWYTLGDGQPSLALRRRHPPAPGGGREGYADWLVASIQP